MFFNDADHWRRRAEESHALAEQLNGDQARAAMLEVAEGYDKLARRAEERSTPDVFVIHSTISCPGPCYA
jgi:hypothetical protein